MRKIALVLKVMAVVAVCLAWSSIADAQATRTWVSGVGDDVNPCSRTAPCKTFAGAISKTAAGGEISVLDPGGYGAVTITKSMVLNGDGTLASILAGGTVQAILVNAGANDTVIIRNLSINGAGTTLGQRGIRVLQAKHVVVENSTIYNFSSFGIEGANTVNPLALTVINTTFSFTGVVGIKQSTLIGNVGSFHNVRVHRGSFGIDVAGGSATVSDSVVTHQTSSGYVAENSAILNVVRSVASNNATGVNAFSAGSTINISDSSIFNNTNNGVLVAAGATCNRFQNNAIFNNTPGNISGTCTGQAPQ